MHPLPRSRWLLPLLLLLGAARAQTSAPPGWNASRHAISATAAVGLVRLPAGTFAAYDGAALVELDPATGATTRTLFRPPATPYGPPFGSFLRLDPGRGELVFGESSDGWLWGIDPSTLATRRIARLAHNFDAAFDPRGRLFVSANTNYVFGQRSPNELWFVDPASGTCDLVAAIDGPSGPLAFSDAGDLLHVPQTWTFPVPRGALALLRFTAAQIDAALGPGHLAANEATVLATGLSGAYALAVAGDGAVWASDPTRGELQRVRPGSVVDVVFEGHGVDHYTSLHFERAAPTPFQSFGPEDGGALHALATDWAGAHHLVTFRPRPARLRATAPNPLPRAPFAFVLDQGPASGWHVLAIALHTGPTTVLDLGRPIALDLDLATLLAVLAPLPLDPLGNALLPLDASAAGPGAPPLAWQALVLDAGASPRGATNAWVTIVP